MRTRWTRTTFARWCCGTLQPPGTPFLEIQVAGVTRALWRCPACAEEAPPADLAPLPEPAPLRASWLRPTRPPAFDWKARQSGAREPGEEG
jgi:hypothetical protein